MQNVKVNLGARAYHIQIRPGALDLVGATLRDLLPDRRQAVVITDQNVARHYSARVVASLEQAGFTAGTITVPAGESSKSLAMAARLYDGLADRQRGRHDPIIALGGGVVGDLAGFVAATWMRGVPLVQCPTSLEAMIDASVGGKTAVNHESGKNRIGAFHQPVAVMIDPDCLATLDDRDFRAALAESVKHAVIADPDFLSWHEVNAHAILGRDPATLIELIGWNCRIKACVVERDERENASDEVGRAALNFGHTIGHAIEEASNYLLRHGEAVALGMVGALALSVCRCGLPAEVRGRVELLLSRLSLPTTSGFFGTPDELMAALGRDKKNRSAAVVRFVLLKGLGVPCWHEISAADELAPPVSRVLGRSAAPGDCQRSS